MEESSCPACASQAETSIRPPADGYAYVRCSGCGLGRIDPLPPQLVEEGFYEDGYFVDGGDRGGYADYAADERWHRHTARLRLKRLARARGTTTPGRVVDVGAALGYFLQEARSDGWQVAGMERSRWAADQGRASGLRIEDSLPGLADFGPADAVTMCQVLEHIPDPRTALQEAAALLRPGGVLLCETWDLDSKTARVAGRRWQQLSAPSVLWLFQRASITRLLSAAGFVLTSWSVSPKLVGAATVLGQLDVPGGRALTRLARHVPVPYVFDDLVTFSARRL